MIITGERQVAPSLDGIRRDHVARYEWAAGRIGGPARIVDVACGIGYGSKILAQAGHTVLGIDRDADAVRYGRKFHRHAQSQLEQGDVQELRDIGEADVAVSFETIEHLPQPEKLLRAVNAPLLLASVPNEDVFPWEGHAFHFRHYTRDEFEQLLNECGWEVFEWWGQEGPESEVERDVNGRTLIAVARKKQDMAQMTDNPVVQEFTDAEFDHYSNPPEHVSILGLGPSLDQYLDVVKRLGGKHAFCDETWGINAVGGVLLCDVIFHMDDVRVQETRAKARPESNIAKMLEWIKVHPGPIITSRANPEYPGLIEFPLEAVLNDAKHAYFNSTAAYAIAYAIHIGVKRISLFGCDYTYPNAHDAEKGRACVEWWLGLATARGIQIAVAKNSTLMDAIHTEAERLYGYDMVDVTIRTVDGQARVDFVDRETTPTADEIEAKYDHSRHPNSLVE